MVNIFLPTRNQGKQMTQVMPSYLESQKPPASMGRKVPPLPPTGSLWDAVSTVSAFCLKRIPILGSLKGFLNLFSRGVHVPFYTLLWGPYSHYLSLFKGYLLFIYKDHEVRIFWYMAKVLQLTITDHPEYYTLKCPLYFLFWVFACLLFF